MKKKNQEITDKKIIEEILTNSKICRVAMNDFDAPYIIPFNYGYKDNSLYIHTAADGKKIDLLTKNNNVCFEIEDLAEIVKHEKACKWTTTYRSLIGYGNIEIITDFEQKEKGLEIIMLHHGATGIIEFDPKHINAIVILKLKIDRITGKQSSNWNIK